MNLTTPLSRIKGVGEKTSEQFEAAGLSTVGDLIEFLPRKHEDFSDISQIASIKPGKSTIKARCESVTTRMVRRGMKVTTATLVDSTGKLKAVWFNQAYRATQLKDSQKEFFFSGSFEFQYNRYQLTNPSVEAVSDMPIQTDRLLPIYPQIKGLKTQLVRKITAELRPLIMMLPETLPAEIISQYKLVGYGQALLGMHFPSSAEEITRARERLAFEEVFMLLLASQYNKRENEALVGWHIPFDQQTIKQAVAALPFTLTNAQRQVLWEVIQDFEQATPMNRLLQGDVGSGKTVVAALAAYQAAQAGFQTAIMAPTEILARQHAESVRQLLEPFGVRIGLLTGSVKAANRPALLQAATSGEVDIVIGTHALIQDTVSFHKLGFVVIDEQHRFGVAQRQALLAKSEHMPHLLAMTATPIPRSLALTVYGELDVSVLRELPAGRQPIETKIWSPTSRTKLLERIDSEIEAGRQAYVICSLIDANPANDRKSVETEYKRLQILLKKRRIGLLHGKLKAEEKDAIMTEFTNGRIDVLVSTTVVEVGVNVPNATVMLIENADTFGLSQLHQLRGRVGRGEHKSYCYLMTSDDKKPSERLREVETSTDGFYLAEVDMRLRGPGEIYGKAQSGALNLQIATLADTELIARAQKAAKWFVDSDQDLLQYTQVATQVKKYQRLTTLN